LSAKKREEGGHKRIKKREKILFLFCFFCPEKSSKSNMSFYIGLSFFSTDTAAAQKKYSSAEARRILALFNGYSAEEANSIYADIREDAAGRPYLFKKDADFSITHCSCRGCFSGITSVSFIEGGNLRTGCDIERVLPRKGAKEIANEFYSKYEKQYICNTGKFDLKKFYEIWTLKECYIKLKGLSVFDMACVPSFISQSLKFEFTGTAVLPLFFTLYEFTDNSNPIYANEHYMLAAVIEGSRDGFILQPPEIIWFSQSSFVCKIIVEINAALNPAHTVSPKM